MVECKDTLKKYHFRQIIYLVIKSNRMAERANVVLASKDAIIYPDAEEYYLYSNQWIPLMEHCTIQEKVRLGSILDKMCGGGLI